MAKTDVTAKPASPARPGFFPARQDLDEFFGRFFGHGVPFAGAPAAPAVNVAEKDGVLTVTAEVPGIAAEDLDVSVEGRSLVLKGKTNWERDETEKDWHIVERRQGSFMREIPLGFVPAVDSVEAAFKDGVLTLTIPRPADETATTNKIAIKAG